MDLHLPGMNGFAATDQLRKLNIQSPIYILSANSERIIKTMWPAAAPKDLLKNPKPATLEPIVALKPLPARYRSPVTLSRLGFGWPSFMRVIAICCHIKCL